MPLSGGANYRFDGLAETGQTGFVGNPGNPLPDSLTEGNYDLHKEISVTKMALGGWLVSKATSRMSICPIQGDGPFYVGVWWGMQNGSTGGAATIELCMVTGTISQAGIMWRPCRICKELSYASSASAGTCLQVPQLFECCGMVGEVILHHPGLFCDRECEGAVIYRRLGGDASGSTQFTSSTRRRVSGTGSLLFNFGGLVGDASGSTVIDSLRDGNVTGKTMSVVCGKSDRWRSHGQELIRRNGNALFGWKWKYKSNFCAAAGVYDAPLHHSYQ